MPKTSAEKLAYIKAWREANPEKVKKYRRKYLEANYERLIQDLKNWRFTNMDKWKAAIKRRKQTNRKETREAYRKWAAKFPEKVRANKQIQGERRRSREGTFTAADIKRIFSAQKGKCAYCCRSLSVRYSIDHVISLAKGGTNWPSNLQLCCASCNNQKYNKDPIDFARELGRLL